MSLSTSPQFIKQIGRVIMTFTELILALAKAHGVKAGLSMVAAFLFQKILPVSPFMAACTVLVVADWITGVSAARVRKEIIISRGLRKTINKSVYYMLAIMLSQMMQDIYPILTGTTYIVGFYIASTEFLSIIENISTITGTNVIGAVKKTILSRLKK